MGRALGVGAILGVGVGLAVAVGVTVTVAVAVGVADGDGEAVGVGVELGAAAQYLPPVLKQIRVIVHPPQTIISLWVHTAV